MIMDAWSTDILGGTIIDTFFGIPSFVTHYRKMVRLLVQWQFWTETVSDAEQDDSFPLPVGVGVYWRPDPLSDINASAWLPANGDTLFAAMVSWRKVPSSYLGATGHAWEADSGPTPLSVKPSRLIEGIDDEGYGMVIDWSGHSDYQTPKYNNLLGFTGHLTVRTLWERS